MGFNSALLENMGGSMMDRGDLGIDTTSNEEGTAAVDVNADGRADVVIFAENGNFIALNMGDGFDGHTPTGFDEFEDVSDGLNDAGDAGNGDYVSAADVNNDGHLDLFYHYNGGKLFVANGDGTFTEQAAALGIAVHTSNAHKFGSAWGDYDNDGDMDLFAPDRRSAQPATLWRNASAGTAFTDVAASAGVAITDETLSAAWGDYDNDGDLDLYVTTAAGVANALYTNNGDGTFSADDFGAGLTDAFMDAAFVDYDSDGDLDLALTRLDGDGRTVLLQNQTDDDRYLKVRLVGTGAGGVNTLAIGTRLELLDASATTLLGTREVGTARGLGGTEQLWAHFGGVDPATTYTLRVVWPGGETESVAVTPNAVSTTIGSQTIAQMISLEAPAGGARFVRWREVDPTE